MRIRVAIEYLFLLTTVLLISACTNQAGNHDNTYNSSTPAFYDSSGRSYDSAKSALNELCGYPELSDSLISRNHQLMTGRIYEIISAVKGCGAADSITVNLELVRFFNKVSRDEEGLMTAIHIVSDILNNPAAATRDETTYILFLRALLNADSVPSFVKAREAENLKTALLNRPGTLATDFKYLNSQGYQTTLHSFRAARTLLIFYDIECQNCQRILDSLANNAQINEAIKSGQIAVLAIYTEGKKNLWENTKDLMPANWHIGFDLSSILENELYDLPAMPSIYLLDKDKTVLLKDMDISALLN